MAKPINRKSQPCTRMPCIIPTIRAPALLVLESDPPLLTPQMVHVQHEIVRHKRQDLPDFHNLIEAKEQFGVSSPLMSTEGPYLLRMSRVLEERAIPVDRVL